MKTTCNECDGWGEVMAPVGRNFRGVDPPMMPCPECGGSGRVWCDEEDPEGDEEDHDEP